jgi:hypothetical protein
MVAAGLVGAGTAAHGDITTTLTGLGTTNVDVPASHGSTAEAMLTWDANWDQYADWDGRGDVYQVDQPIVMLKFSPVSPTTKITLDRFDLDEFAGGGDTAANWSVTGSVSGLLKSGQWNTFNTANDPNDAGGRSTVQSAAMGAPGETLTLTIDHTNLGAVSYLAMDNLVFSSAIIPEPSTAVMTWLGVGGLGAHAMRKKRKRAV